MIAIAAIPLALVGGGCEEIDARLVEESDPWAEVAAVRGWLGCLYGRRRRRRSFALRACTHKSRLSDNLS
jgi:hypothetical protein